MSLENKRIVIIGGGSGIGLATAKLAAAEGAKVIIASRTQSKLDEAKIKIGSNTDTHTVDLTDEASIKELFERIGSFDHLVITGPAPQFCHFLELDIKQVRQEFEGKFWGQYRAAWFDAKTISQQGSIVFMSGAYSARPVPGASSLAAVQAGIEGLARGLAIDLSPVRVNVISPGLTDTPIVHDAFADDARQKLYEEQANMLPAKRIGTPEDIAGSILDLLTNRYVTGSTLFPDGGYTLR